MNFCIQYSIFQHFSKSTHFCKILQKILQNFAEFLRISENFAKLNFAKFANYADPSPLRYPSALLSHLSGPYARPALRPSASCLPNSGMAPIMPAKAMPSETSTKEPTRAGPLSMSSASSYVGTNCFSLFLLILFLSFDLPVLNLEGPTFFSNLRMMSRSSGKSREDLSRLLET